MVLIYLYSGTKQEERSHLWLFEKGACTVVKFLDIGNNEF